MGDKARKICSNTVLVSTVLVSSCLLSTTQSMAINTQSKVVNVDALNVRAEASASSKKIGSLSRGMVVEVVGISGDWVKINYMGGQFYVFGKYLVDKGSNQSSIGSNEYNTSKASVIASVLNVRSEASSGSSIIGKLYKNNIVEILSYSGDFAKIKYKNSHAYVSKLYIKENPGISVPEVGGVVKNPETIVSKKLKVSASVLNVRSAKSIENNIVGKLYMNSLVEVLSYEGSWAKISYNGKLAYVSKDYLIDVTASLPNIPSNGGVITKPVQSVPMGSKYTTAELNVREDKNTKSKILGVLKKGTKVDIYGVVSGWAKIKYNNKEAYVSESYLSVTAPTVNEPVRDYELNPDYNGKVEFLDWWIDAKDVIPNDSYGTKSNSVLVVEDYVTKLRFNVRRTMGVNHAELEALTPADTEIVRQIWKGFSWAQRPVLVYMGDRVFAASMSGMPHAGLDSAPFLAIVDNRSEGYGRGQNLDAIQGNAMDGHMDLHFLNSTRHKDGKLDTKHQDNIKFLMKQLGYIK